MKVYGFVAAVVDVCVYKEIRHKRTEKQERQ